jgi:hypothetical protein
VPDHAARQPRPRTAAATPAGAPDDARRRPPDRHVGPWPTARWGARLTVGLAAGLVLAAGSAATGAAAPPSAGAARPAQAPSAQAQLDALHSVTVASAVAANGDQNPYGIAVVPKTMGALTAGNLLVADFNDAAGTAGAGTSIVQIDPTTGRTTTFFTGAPVAGPVGIAINPLNDGVWVGDYGAAADGTGANDLLINPAGSLVATFTDVTTAGQASFIGVWGQGVSDVNGAISFYWGNAGNATTGTGGGDVWRLSPHPTGTANGQPVNATYAQLTTGQPQTAAGGNAGTAAGPQGLAYDAANGVLYETNDANDTLYAIAGAATATGPSPATVVYHGSALDSPENVVVDPANGNLLVVNGAGNNDLVEITPAGQVVAERDLAPHQAPGALFGLAVGTDASGNPVIYYGDDDTNTVGALEVPGPGRGYRLADAHGAVFAFGDATYLGGPNTLPGGPGTPIVAMATTPDGNGYWLAGQNGAIYAYGDATYLGGPNTLPGGPGTPIVAMATTPDGNGYWLAGQNGAIYAYGDATYDGSVTGLAASARPTSAITAMAATPDGGGYWLTDAQGGVFAFGDAGYEGSLPGLGVQPASSVRAVAGTP